MSLIKADCSGCHERFTLSTERMVVTMTAPGNGLRGSKRVEARKVTADVSEDPSSLLLMWDCPLCGYAESQEEGVDG